MAVKKATTPKKANQKTSSPKGKTLREVFEQEEQAAPAARPKVDLVALAKKSRELRERHQVPETVKPPAKATKYLVTFDDGTAVYAEGVLADFIYRWLKECELQAVTHRLAIYNGPEMDRIPTDKALDLINR